MRRDDAIAGAGLAGGFLGSPWIQAGSSVTGGILQMESDGALGTTPISINNGTLRTTPDVLQPSNPVSLGWQGSTLETEGDVTFSGVMKTADSEINTADPLVKSGPGMLIIPSSNTSPPGSRMTWNATGGAVDSSPDFSRLLPGPDTNAPSPSYC